MTGLRVRDLEKVYTGGKAANAGLSLEVAPGEVFGLLGPNGAGKTTLVSQIIGLLRPTSGSIHLNGIDLVRRPDWARRLCSYLPQGALPIDSLPARRAVELIGMIRGGRAREIESRAAALFAELEIEEWASELGTKLSGGVQRLAGYAMAAIRPGELVILDEPTNDVDPMRRRLLWRSIRKLANEGSAVLLVTHNVTEAERSVDRLAVLDEGRILAQGTPGSLKRNGHGRLRLDLALEPRSEAPAPPGFAQVRARTARNLLLHLDEEDANRAIEWARAQTGKRAAESFELGPITLEDAYLHLIGRQDLAHGEGGSHEHTGSR